MKLLTNSFSNASDSIFFKCCSFHTMKFFSFDVFDVRQVGVEPLGWARQLAFGLQVAISFLFFSSLPKPLASSPMWRRIARSRSDGGIYSPPAISRLPLASM